MCRAFIYRRFRYFDKTSAAIFREGIFEQKSRSGEGKGQKRRVGGGGFCTKAAFCAGSGGSKVAQNRRFVHVFRLKGDFLRTLFSVIFLYGNAL